MIVKTVKSSCFKKDYPYPETQESGKYYRESIL